MSQSRRTSRQPNGQRRSSSNRDPNARRSRRHSDLEARPHDRTPRNSQPSTSPYTSPRHSSTRSIVSPSRMPRDPLLSPPAQELSRKRSLVRPERKRADPDDPNYHYRQHAVRMNVQPSTTGNDPIINDDFDDTPIITNRALDRTTKVPDHEYWHSGRPRNKPSMKDPVQKPTRKNTKTLLAEQARRENDRDAARALSLWSAYYHLITFWCPDILLAGFGKPQKAQQRAWREKIGLISIILLVCAFVGYLTFGFTATVCPAGGPTRLRVNDVGPGFLIISGQAYDLSQSHHPYAMGIPSGANVLYDLGQPHGGQDASFMFQNVNGHCKGLITAASDSDVPTNANGDLGWYFPCNFFNQDGSSQPNSTIAYYLGYSCHLSLTARTAYYGLTAASEVYYTWDDIKNSSRNLAVWGSDVLDLDLLLWFNKTQVSYPAQFDQIRENPAVRGQDLTLAYTTSDDKQVLECFSEIIKVGSIDTDTIGCIASKVVLYVALTFILSIAIAKFVFALLFQWFLCKKYAADKGVKKNSKQRNEEIEEWTNDIYRPPPKLEDPSVLAFSERSKRSSTFLPTRSRFSSPYALESSFSKVRPSPTTMVSQSSTARSLTRGSIIHTASDAMGGHSQDTRSSLLFSDQDKRHGSIFAEDCPGPSGFIHEAVVPQPPQDWEPYGYPLAHTICLVTAYSEGEASIRTTLDSIATTDYPNSHKLMLVICDGLIKGKGEKFTTPEIVLNMMRDHTILPDEVQAFSYVAVASGSKRHGMAKVYSGFYDYGEQSRIHKDQQQRVPVVVIVKTGTPDEIRHSKPGNRGKRDSQIILMSFLQKVMFDERMTELEFELFNGIWKITGISPDYYEMVMMVDADTKVFPDSMTHMVSAMVKDPEIMGLCGETKIANKRISWVTAIQVFEYFISHHLAKSFESVFGGVTCLPGCFSMYRIKAPKGGQNYWVPILANPDIVEHYSENVVDTLHKKNLLLLGEDRYLSTLMLKTFPKRKQVFVPQAVCKTTVPETFKVLLSQRRRWINSTIHNLMELVLVRDLCGTFCFSMQFVVFIELIGTLVLPAAITFTFYLIIRAIVDAITHQPIPVIPLVLLALILGLPAVLIVLTAHRWSYVVWMLIYLLSLPIWNGILPAYSYWKFDDFSWGETRKTSGETTKKAGLEYEGEFDSSKITMKRWVDFEQERRLRLPAEVRPVSEVYGHGGGFAANGLSSPPSAWNRPGLGKRDSAHTDYSYGGL